MTTPTVLDRALEAAAGVIQRWEPEAAARAMGGNVVLIDIRSFDARQRDGVVPGSLHIPRTVLEWRLEPGGGWRSPHVRDGDRIILVCDHGYSSVFAAASLVALGWDAGDVSGGILGWRTAGLALRPATDPPLVAGELPGMRPPEP
jgi:rhodanese-related sulfurtransferase